MTDYTSIADSQVDPKAPVTSDLMTALRDNPIAIGEGSTGAPRIQGKAAKRIDDFPDLTITAADTYSLSGYVLDTTVGTTSTANDVTYVLGYTLEVIKFNGSARFKVSHSRTGGTGSSILRITKNDVQISSWTNGSVLSVERSADVSVVVGDVIKWEHYTSSETAVSNLSGLSTTGSDTYTALPLILKASEV